MRLKNKDFSDERFMRIVKFDQDIPCISGLIFSMPFLPFRLLAVAIGGLSKLVTENYAILPEQKTFSCPLIDFEIRFPGIIPK